MPVPADPTQPDTTGTPSTPGQPASTPAPQSLGPAQGSGSDRPSRTPFPPADSALRTDPDPASLCSGVFGGVSTRSSDCEGFTGTSGGTPSPQSSTLYSACGGVFGGGGGLVGGEGNDLLGGAIETPRRPHHLAADIRKHVLEQR